MKKKQGKKNGNLDDGIRRIVNVYRQQISDTIFKKLTLCIVEGQSITPNEFARRWLIQNSTVRTDNLLAGFVDEHYAPYVELKSQNFNYQIVNTKLLDSSNWSYKIMNKFATNALQKDIDIIHLLAQMQAILMGLFSQADSSMVTSVIKFEHLGPLQAFFYTKTDKNMTLFWEVGIDKIPKIARVAKEYQKDLLGYDYIHTITFIDCRYDCNVEQNAAKLVTNYYLEVRSAIHRQDYQSVITTSKSYQSIKYSTQEQLFSIENNDLGSLHGELDYNRRQHEIIKWMPHRFPTIYLTREEQSSFKYDESIKRWISKDYEAIQQAKKMREYQAKINKDLLKRYADFSSAAKLVELLQKVPNFKIKLTEEEQEVVGSDGNVMVIGRSGTGKTTCSILRLFAMETLFKLRLELYQQKHENILQNYQYNHQEVNNNVGLHCVFATASPVLTTEVKRYYGKLTAQIKAELEKKKQKDRLTRLQKEQKAQREQSENQFNQSTVQIVDDKQIEENYFEQQIGGIQLQKEQGGFQEDLNEEDWEKEEEKLKQELNAFHSFADMQDSDFPAFLTIKKLVLLIDGSLANPFFSRTYENKILNSATHAQWSTENTGVIFINTYKKGEDQDIEYDEEEYEALFEENELNLDDMDEQELEQEYQRQVYLMNKPQLSAKEDNNMTKLSQEVDFDFFLNNFWYSKKNRYQNNNLNPAFVWTQIYSHIKGAAASHTYPGHFIPKKVYLKLNKNENLFDEIFECYVHYEKWKIQQGYYDFMDVVNHILVQLICGRCHLIPIHYLMIDECQDLPHAVLLLLCKITEQGLFFSGDTAQNIAKGVGFRFQDLKSLFRKPEITYNAKQNDLKIHQLTINFRSHNNILQLANCLVSLLEIFFPNTIDKLKKERSNISGPKPMLVNGDKDDLFYLLSGEHADKSQQVGERLPIEFGCNQVVLVKDQESKNNIPSILQHALVLTIYEAKGLEFDDVILFNFFQDHYIGDTQWKLLQTCEILDEEISKEKFMDSCTKHQTLDDEATIFTGFEERNGNIIVKRIATQNKFYDELTYNYSQLCNEIKQLYVAVTRPRLRLIIYDENPQARQYIQNIWSKLNLIEYFVQTTQEDRNVEKFAKQTSKEEWKKQGLKMFRNRYYEQAEKCFEQSKDEQLFIKARAFKVATEANALILQYSQTSSNSVMKKKEKKQLLASLKQQQKEKFSESAQLFMKIQNYKQAAQCYYSGEMYEEALSIYVKQEMFNEAGEAAYKCEKYSEAADYFLKSNDFIRAVDACEKAEAYEQIFKVIHQLRDKIPVETRSAFLKKYLPIILNKMTTQIGQLEQVNEQQTKNQEKKPLVIEESSDEEEDDEDEENGKEDGDRDKNQVEQVQAKEGNEEQKEKIIELSSQFIQSLPDQSQPSILVKQESMNNNSEDSQSFSVENTQSFQIEQSQVQDSKIISVVQSESFQVEKTLKEEDDEEQNFEHLSHFDPEDQWLKNDNKSIIETIVSKKSEQSDFSAFSYAQMHSNPNVQFVKTKTDIFIQDTIMQQIIKYISMFSDEFKYQLYNQRSKSAQLSNKQIDQHQFDYMVDFILDLDLVDISFIYLVLDILEQFKNYKLCIFVCNRYKLADQLGRYLVSIASTYSPLALHSASLNIQYLINGKQRQAQIDKGLVSAFAVHNVFENINPEFISLKFNDTKLTSQNSLGLECYSQLLLLGFWKKTVYQMDVQNSLLVCKLFMDFKNWRFIYYSNLSHQVTNKILENEQKDRDLAQIYQTTLMLIQKKLDICFSTMIRGIDMLTFTYPKDQQEMEFAIITLEQYYSELITQLVMNQKAPQTLFYRPHTLDLQKTIKVELNPKQNLPKMYSLTEEVIFYLINKTEVPEEILNKLCNIVLDYKNPHTELEIYQSVFLLVLYCQYVVHNSGLVKTQAWITQLDVKTYAALIKSLRFIRNLLNTNQHCLQKLSKIVTRSVLFYFKIRQPDNVALLKPYINSIIINRSSVIIQGLIENRHNLQLKGNTIVLDDYYFVDIDFEFISAPRSSVIFLISKKLSNELKTITSLRRASFDEYHFDQLYPHEYEDHFDNLSIYLYSRLKFTQNLQSRKNISLITVDDWIKKEQQISSQKMQEGLNKKKIQQLDDQVGIKLIFKSNKKNLKQQHYFLKNPYLKCQSSESRNYNTHQALKYINEQYKDSGSFHRSMVKFIHLMNYANNNHFTYQYINSKIEQGQCSKYEPYLQYLECQICKQFNVISDATDLYFSYLKVRKDLMAADELYYQLSYLFLNNIVGYLLKSKNNCQIKIANRYFIYFDKITQPDEQSYLYETNFHPVQNQDGIANIIEQLSDLQQDQPQVFGFKIMLLIYTLVLNLNDIKAHVINEIKKIIYNATTQDEVEQYAQIMKAVNLPDKQRLDALAINSNVIKLDFAQDIRLYSLNVVNKLTPQTIDDAYQSCLDEWSNIQKRSEELENKTRKIVKVLKERKKQEKFVNPYLYGFGEYDFSRKLKTSKYIDIINEFIRVRKILLSTFYSMLLTNSIDFHFISLQLKQLDKKEDEFNTLWEKYSSKKIIQSEFVKQYDEQYKNTSVIIETLLQWQKNNVTFEQNVNKLLERNRKLLALKWMNNRAGLALQKIQKRKKGLKRQKLQEQKKLFMKLS